MEVSNVENPCPLINIPNRVDSFTLRESVLVLAIVRKKRRVTDYIRKGAANEVGLAFPLTRTRLVGGSSRRSEQLPTSWVSRPISDHPIRQGSMC